MTKRRTRIGISGSYGGMNLGDEAILESILGQFQGAFDAMRLHFLIFAAIQGVAFAPLPYATKVSGLLEDLGMEMPALGGIGIGQLLAHIDRSWDVRETIREEIAQRVPALKARARQTADYVVRLLDAPANARHASAAT